MTTARRVAADRRAAAEKKRRLIEGESDDDEEFPKKRMKAEPKGVAIEAEDVRRGGSPRLAYLCFRTETSGTHAKWPVSEEVLSRIGVYAQKVRVVKSQTQPGHRLTITDDVRRNEDDLFLVIDYLTTGQIEAVDHSNPGKRLESLKKLVHLGKVANDMNVQSLAAVAFSRIVSQDSLDISSFLELANLCYQKRCILRRWGSTMIGPWIKVYLEKNYQTLDKGGHLETVKRQEGTLKELLIEVLMDRVRESR